MSARASILAAAALSLAVQIPAAVFGHWEWFRTAHYAAIFLVGCAIARNLDSISAWYARLDGTARAAFAMASSLLFAYGRQAEGLGFARGRFEDWAVALGASGLIVLSLNALAFRRFLRTTALQKLGAVSFSTYLVHVPILLALVHGLAGSTSWTTIFLLYATLTGMAALLFHKFIEDPARRAGKRLAERIARPAQYDGYRLRTASLP
jgi:peptidoglycan/LPS O-acetylase OafA/YrhL